MKGTYISTDSELSDCDPIRYNRDLTNGTLNLNNETLDGNLPAVPCGLVAKSFFNDKYEIFKQNGEKVTIDEKNIAW